jgi:hypothetical protein
MRAVRRLLVGVALLVAGIPLTSAPARADTLHADFDGDGVRDRIDIGLRVRELDVRLSTSRTPQRLRADDLILRFVVTDIDRDGDPDVVASTRRIGLQIWINTGRGRFAARSSRVDVVIHAGRPSVGGAVNRQSDDSACTDQTRELVPTCHPRGQPLLASRRTTGSTRPRESRFEHSPRIARGPPFASPRPSTFVA